ncbi:hypothetical protein ACEUCJ_19215 [Aeromonas rivipollensis]|uniref:hypothetical protein n=1 Tax=Aeromonas rivipollensis TaxID=948519 RepID=UPI0038D0496D
MAPRKKADDKSAQLDAAAVGAGTELVQAQTEPLQTVDLEQAATAQGVDVVTDHQAAFDAAAQLDQAVVEQAHDQVQQALDEGKDDDQGSAMAIGASSEPGANLSDAVTSDLPDWLLGQFDVKAKSPAGFWRCQVHFLHSSPTRVFVVENKAAVPHDHDCAIPCCYLTPEEAQRVHKDSWLTVVPGSEVTKE